jgi:hypothetical protein
MTQPLAIKFSHFKSLVLTTNYYQLKFHCVGRFLTGMSRLNVNKSDLNDSFC